MLFSAFLVPFLICLTTHSDGIKADDESKEDSKEVLDKIVNNKPIDKSFNFQLSIKKDFNVHQVHPIPYHDDHDDDDSPEYYHSSLSAYHGHDSSEHHHESSEHDHGSNEHSGQIHHGSYEHSSNQNYHSSQQSSNQNYHSYNQHSSNQNYHSSSDHSSNQNYHSSHEQTHHSTIKEEKPVVHHYNTHIHAVNVHVNGQTPQQVESFASATDVTNITQSELSTVTKPVKQEASEDCHHESSSEEHYSVYQPTVVHVEHQPPVVHVEHQPPVVHVEHHVQVPVIQTEVKIPVIAKEHHLSHLHHGLAALKEHRKQYIQQKKDLIHSLHRPAYIKHVGVQLAVPALQVQYGGHGSHEDEHGSISGYSHFSAGFKSAGGDNLPPQILPASRRSDIPSPSESEEKPVSRKKRSTKDKLDEKLFNHLMVKYLHHGDPLHIHEHSSMHHGRFVQPTLYRGYSVSYPHKRSHQKKKKVHQRRHIGYQVVGAKHYGDKKQTDRKIDLHLGLPALNFILHISPVLANETSIFSLKAEDKPRAVQNTVTETKEKDSEHPPSSTSAHGLFFSGPQREQHVPQYEVHEETNSSMDAPSFAFAQTESPSIIHFLIPTKPTQSPPIRYETDLTIPYHTSIESQVAEGILDERLIFQEATEIKPKNEEPRTELNEVVPELEAERSDLKEVESVTGDLPERKEFNMEIGPDVLDEETTLEEPTSSNNADEVVGFDETEDVEVPEERSESVVDFVNGEQRESNTETSPDVLDEETALQEPSSSNDEEITSFDQVEDVVVPEETSDPEEVIDDNFVTESSFNDEAVEADTDLNAEAAEEGTNDEEIADSEVSNGEQSNQNTETLEEAIEARDGEISKNDKAILKNQEISKQDAGLERNTEVPAVANISNNSETNDSIRGSRLVFPNELNQGSVDLQSVNIPEIPVRRSDLPVDDDSETPLDALLPVIPVIIRDLRAGRVSSGDRKILKEVFGQRWADIETRAVKESMDTDNDPQRVRRSLNEPEFKGKKNRRSTDYLDVLTEYFEDREKEKEEDYAYEDDGEGEEEGPDVSELMGVAQAHNNWKTHKILPSI